MKGNWDLENLSDSPKVTELKFWAGRIPTQAVWLQAHFSLTVTSFLQHIAVYFFPQHNTTPAFSNVISFQVAKFKVLFAATIKLVLLCWTWLTTTQPAPSFHETTHLALHFPLRSLCLLLWLLFHKWPWNICGFLGSLFNCFFFILNAFFRCPYPHLL